MTPALRDASFGSPVQRGFHTRSPRFRRRHRVNVETAYHDPSRFSRMVPFGIFTTTVSPSA
jgi:hypothetical protein